MSEPPYRLEVEIPAVPRLENAMSKAHWSVEHQHRKRWRELVNLYIRPRFRPKAPLKRALVKIDVWRKGKEPDPDNLVRSMKPILDALQPTKKSKKRRGGISFALGASVIEDDQSENLVGGRAEVEWHPARKNGGREKLRIVVEEEHQQGNPNGD